MAHKHNRRRIRHRSRRHKYEHTLPTVHETPSYDSLSSLSSPQLSYCSTAHSPSPRLSYSDSATIFRWHNPQLAYNRGPGRDIETTRCTIQEARFLQYFGGEPGEDYDYSMVDNMQKMFDSIGVHT